MKVQILADNRDATGCHVRNNRHQLLRHSCSISAVDQLLQRLDHAVHSRRQHVVPGIFALWGANQDWRVLFPAAGRWRRQAHGQHPCVAQIHWWQAIYGEEENLPAFLDCEEENLSAFLDCEEGNLSAYLDCEEENLPAFLDGDPFSCLTNSSLAGEIHCEQHSAVELLTIGWLLHFFIPQQAR